MQKAFTLIELIVYLAILLIVITSVMLFLLSIMKETSRSSFKEEVQRNIAVITRVFDFEVRSASSIYLPTSNFTGSPIQLSLVTPKYLRPGETTSYVDIYLNNGRICVTRESMRVSCVTSNSVNVTSLEFFRFVQPGGKESLRMRFTIQYNNPNPNFQFPETVQTSARLRSY